MKTPQRLLLADDHAIVREELRSLLEPDFEIGGEVSDGRALVGAVESLRPDRLCRNHRQKQRIERVAFGAIYVGGRISFHNASSGLGGSGSSHDSSLGVKL